DDDPRLQRARHRRDGGRPVGLLRQGRARREHGLEVRVHPAVPGTPGAAGHVRPRRLHRARLPVRPVRAPGAGRRRRDRRVLRAQLRCRLPVVLQGRRQRPRRPPALRLAPQGEGRPAGRQDQVELHQVPPRPRRHGHLAALPDDRARQADRTDREGPQQPRAAPQVCL
ncbi:MAG: Glutathione peroxidase @ Thioredoxin peroxidase, partial [uncultured Nocardioides sp.]